jgi:alkylation response protein AidB-like acyl-CoA dehydrogenase
MFGPHLLAERLERDLGDPFTIDAPLGFRQSVDRDEREVFPEAALRVLHEWGFARYLVPSADGGAFESFDHLLALTRVVSRRDLTVAIAAGQTFLGAVPVWIDGTRDQRRRLAGRILDGTLAALALTERAHGSDILANETSATAAVARGYLLNGEKWLINNGTRSGFLSVFARTAPTSGPRGYSLFLVDKSRVDAATISHPTKIRTLGIRGADISGVRFDDCVVSSADLVGEAGHGLDLVLKALQVTRTLCAGFSLGAADTALRTTLRFATTRRLYGSTVAEIPEARRALAGAFADVLLADCASTVAARALHLLPGELSVWSAMVKYFVPTTIDSVFRSLAVVLGARHYLREDHDDGIFQKMLRDHAVVGLFDGSTAVNLAALAAQLPLILGRRSAQTGEDAARRTRNLDGVCTLASPLPSFDPSALSLHNRGIDTLLQNMPRVIERLRDSVAGAAPEVREPLDTLASRLEDDLHALDGIRVASFDHAIAYCRLVTALACAALWTGNQSTLGPFFESGTWLALSLNRLVRVPIEIAEDLQRSVSAAMLRRIDRRQLFGIVPLSLI